MSLKKYTTLPFSALKNEWSISNTLALSTTPKSYVHTQQKFSLLNFLAASAAFPWSLPPLSSVRDLCPSLGVFPWEQSLEPCLWSPFFWLKHSWASDVRAPGRINMQCLYIQVRKLWVPCLAARIQDGKQEHMMKALLGDELWAVVSDFWKPSLHNFVRNTEVWSCYLLFSVREAISRFHHPAWRVLYYQSYY